jgi:hypothetical protein
LYPDKRGAIEVDAVLWKTILIDTGENMGLATRNSAMMYDSLVAAAAIGVSPLKCYRQNEALPAAAAKRQSKPEFKEDVQEARSKLLARADGKFTRALNSVADAMIQLSAPHSRKLPTSPLKGPSWRTSSRSRNSPT